MEQLDLADSPVIAADGEKRVAVMGGSFNPPTTAHLTLMCAAMAAVKAETGIFVPSGDAYVRNKLRRQGQESGLLPEQLRLSMLLAMCEGEPGLTADDCEFCRDPQWRTYETMCALQEKYPTAELFFIMGADKLSILPRWHQKQAFLSRFRILAVSRDGASPEPLIERDLFLRKNRSAFTFMEAPDGLDGISSSAVREALKNGGDAAEKMLHPAVRKLLAENETPDFSIRCFDGAYGFLSNFYEAPVTFGGLTYPTSEAAYQAQKTLAADERERFTLFSPGKAKRAGGKLTPRPDWDEVKLGLMEEIVRAKFAQNPDIAKRLLATGDRELVEGTLWHDTFWGIDLTTGEGENHLGRIMMNVRRELKE